MYASLAIARASSAEIDAAADDRSAAGSVFWQPGSATNKVAARATDTGRCDISMMGLRVASADRHRFGKFPAAVQDFGARPVEPHGVVPAPGYRDAVGHLAIAASELDRNGAVRSLLAGDAVHRVRIQRVLLEVTLRVVDTHRPECLHRHVADVEPVHRGPLIPGRRDIEVLRVRIGISAP